MLYQLHSGQVPLDGTALRYVAFGTGERPLILLPGLGDGLQPVGGGLQAAGLAWSYRIFAKKFRVYLFSRKDALRPGCTIREMARDQKRALDQLELKQVSVLGVSQGGMIAQWLAIDFPERVEKLVLGVTTARPSDGTRQIVRRWSGLARAGQYQQLLADSCEQMYSEKTLRVYRPMVPLMARINRPKDLERFVIQAEACLGHDTSGELEKIVCPTLILAGAEDRVMGPDAAAELAAGIAGSRMRVYEGLGHGAFEETPEFNRRAAEFLA